jgi:hypothetical protein
MRVFVLGDKSVSKYPMRLIDLVFYYNIKMILFILQESRFTNEPRGNPFFTFQQVWGMKSSAPLKLRKPLRDGHKMLVRPLRSAFI